MDDLTTDEDKQSPRMMGRIYDWIFSAVAGLAKDALMIYLNTIFNAMDPMARILDRIERGELERYLGLRLSAEIDDHTVLWPEYWSMEDLAAKRQEVGSQIYLVEYMSIIMDRISAIAVIGVGIIVGVLGLSKAIDWFLANHRRSTYYCILGMTLGSVVAVVIQALYEMSGTDVDAMMIVGIVIGIIVGLIIGYAISKVSPRYAEETIGGEIEAQTQ